MKRNLSLIAICILLAAGCGKDPVPGINDEDKKPGTEVPGNTDKPDDPGNTDDPDDPDDPENQKPAVELTLPADPKPASISFSHRILLVQHTGTYCPNCPRLMTSLKELALDEAYAAKYHHVAAHSYNESGDLAYSEAAKNLSQLLCSGYYPELTFNLTKESTGTSLSVNTIMGMIDELHKDEADAGIAAKTLLEGNTLYIKAGIKAATAGTYRIAAWLLEDNIRSEQEGAFEDWQHTHNNAIRAMAGSTLNTRISGEKVGILNQGGKAEIQTELKIERYYKMDNCKVLVLATAATPDGRYDVVNCTICPINGAIGYLYN